MIPGRCTQLGPSSKYALPGSLQFRSASLPNLYRASLPLTTGTKFTWSGWIKPNFINRNNSIFASYVLSADGAIIRVLNAAFSVEDITAGAYAFGGFTGTLVASVWQHYHVMYDSTLATGADRLQIWRNGSRQTLSNVGGTTAIPPLNHVSKFATNTASYPRIGCQPSGSAAATNAANFFDGLMADFHFLDSIVAPASDFGRLRSGIWVPKEYKGGHGAKGFHLDFSDNAAVANLGFDRSGNGLHRTTVSGFLTSDKLSDVP